MSEQEQFIIDETSIFINNRGVPIGKSRDGKDLYALHRLGRELVETAAHQSGQPVILPNNPIYSQTVRNLIRWLQEHEYGPKGQEIIPGPAVTVMNIKGINRRKTIIFKRLSFLNDIASWRKITPPTEQQPQPESSKPRNFPFVEKLEIWD